MKDMKTQANYPNFKVLNILENGSKKGWHLIRYLLERWSLMKWMKTYLAGGYRTK